MFFKDCKAYWRQCVIDYIDCMADDNKHKYTDKEIDAVVDKLLNDDTLWGDIDFTINKYLTIERSKNEH